MTQPTKQWNNQSQPQQAVPVQPTAQSAQQPITQPQPTPQQQVPQPQQGVRQPAQQQVPQQQTVLPQQSVQQPTQPVRQQVVQQPTQPWQQPQWQHSQQPPQWQPSQSQPPQSQHSQQIPQRQPVPQQGGSYSQPMQPAPQYSPFQPQHMTQQPTAPQPTAALPVYPAAYTQSSQAPQYPQPQQPQPQPMAPQYSQTYPPQPSPFTPASLPPQGPFIQAPLPQASSPQAQFPQGPFPQSPVQQAVWPSGAAATPPTSPQSKPQHSNVQMLLLVLGVALVTIAVLAFASFAYGLLGDIGRAVSIGVVGAIALAVGMALTNRLRVTAEGLTWAGLAALSIDAPLVSGIPPVTRTIPNGVCTGVLILLVTALAFGLRAIASHLPSNQTATVTDSQPNTQTIPSNAASSTLPDSAGFSEAHAAEYSTEHPVTQPAVRPVPLSPVPLSPIPLRATTLYAMCAIPLAFMSIASSLPTDNHNVEWVLTVEIGSAAALLFAIFVQVPHTSRYADFEWMTSLTAATVGLTAVTFFGYALIMDADPLWLVIIICLIPPALWAAMLVMLHLKPTARTGSTLPPVNRVMSTIGFIWSLSAGSESLLRRVLNGPLGNDQAAQTVADLLMIAITGFAITAATLMFRHTKRFTISKQERVSASVIGSLMMLIVIDSDFTHGSPLPMVVSIVGLVVMLAVTAISWIVAAQPTTTPVAQPAPQSIQQPQQAMPQPAQPQWPQSTLPHGTAPKPLPAEHITVTVFTAITSLTLIYLAVTDPQPYAPMDLFAIMSGATALVIGVRWMQVRPALRSWPALWPALTLLMVPSLLISWFEPLSLPRVLALFAISICALLLGALRGLQAPLVYGTVILVIHVLTVIWPWLAEFSRHYWWVWLLIGGVLLIAAAARYEASMRSMRSIASRISDLR